MQSTSTLEMLAESTDPRGVPIVSRSYPRSFRYWRKPVEGVWLVDGRTARAITRITDTRVYYIEGVGGKLTQYKARLAKAPEGTSAFVESYVDAWSARFTTDPDGLKEWQEENWRLRNAVRVAGDEADTFDVEKRLKALTDRYREEKSKLETEKSAILSEATEAARSAKRDHEAKLLSLSEAEAIVAKANEKEGR